MILFVRKYRPYATSAFSPAPRTLEFKGDGGSALKLKLNDLVVYLHGDLCVMPPGLFLPAADDLDD